MPTGTVPMLPVTGPSGIGTLLCLLALGALVALLAGLVVHHREHDHDVAVDTSNDVTVAPVADVTRPRTRLSA